MMNPDERLLDQLPHRPPFRFITDTIQLQPTLDGSASWRVTGTESFLAGHFPGAPIVPGVLIAEALAQLSGLIIFGRTNSNSENNTFNSAVPARLAHVDVRFLDAVSPPADIQLHSKLARDLGALRLFDVEARVQDRVIARGQLALVINAEASKDGAP